MCLNCAYSKDGKPSDAEECSVCSRNPTLLSKKFTPKIFRGRRIERPIDFYISREHYELLKAKLTEEIRKALPKDPKKPFELPWVPLRWEYSGTDTSTYSWATVSTVPEARTYSSYLKHPNTSSVEKTWKKDEVRRKKLSLREKMKGLDGLEV